MCVRWLLCVFDWVIGVGRGDARPPDLHCASDPWPFVTLSEWEERDAGSEREGF